MENEENDLLSTGAWMTAVFSGDGRMLSLEATLMLPRLPCACNKHVKKNNMQRLSKGGAIGTLIIAVGDRARAELKAFTADLVPMVGEAWILPKKEENAVKRSDDAAVSEPPEVFMSVIFS
jgi:hypothetical protein